MCPNPSIWDACSRESLPKQSPGGLPRAHLTFWVVFTRLQSAYVQCISLTRILSSVSGEKNHRFAQMIAAGDVRVTADSLTGALTCFRENQPSGPACGKECQRHFAGKETERRTKQEPRYKKGDVTAQEGRQQAGRASRAHGDTQHAELSLPFPRATEIWVFLGQ